MKLVVMPGHPLSSWKFWAYRMVPNRGSRFSLPSSKLWDELLDGPMAGAGSTREEAIDDFIKRYKEWQGRNEEQEIVEVDL